MNWTDLIANRTKGRAFATQAARAGVIPGVPSGTSFNFAREEKVAVSSGHYDYEEPQKRSLAVEAVTCSSLDMADQGPACVLSPEATFWSSAGSADTSAEEFVVLRLRYPICAVKRIVMVVYRALFQLGQPVFPPSAIQSVVCGAPLMNEAANAASKINTLSRVRTHDAPQFYDFEPYALLGNHITIRLIGKRQKQLADQLYYTVLRHIKIAGYRLNASRVHLLLHRMITAPANSATNTNTNIPVDAAGDAAESLVDPRLFEIEDEDEEICERIVKCSGFGSNPSSIRPLYLKSSECGWDREWGIV